MEALTPELLRAWPLPAPEEAGDKDARGRVLVVGGSPQAPGAALLAAVSAARAGAGKVRLGVGRGQAAHFAFAVPESYVLALEETEGGGLALSSAETLAPQIEAADGVLIGPGMMDKDAVAALTPRLLASSPRRGLVLDAGVLGCLADCGSALAAHAGRLVLPPHAGEMAHLLGVAREEIERDPLGAAREAAQRYKAVVIMKGRESLIASPEGRVLKNSFGHVGLATAGSGDTLAGLIVGLIARGAEPMQAAAWAVWSHAQAGSDLAEAYGGIGFLARELPERFPRLLNALSP